MLQCLCSVWRCRDRERRPPTHHCTKMARLAIVQRWRGGGAWRLKRLGKWGLSCDSCWNSRFLYNGSELKWREGDFFFLFLEFTEMPLQSMFLCTGTTASSCSSINFSEFTFYKKKKIIYLLWTLTSSLERQYGAKLYWRYFTLRTSFVNWLCSRQSSCLRVTLCLVSSNIMRKRSDLILVCGAETTLQNWRDFTAL